MTDQELMNGTPDMLHGNRKRRILIVEDEFINREILKANLDQDYDILLAENGEQALSVAEAEADTLSLVLLDLNLPDMHGMDILRRMKEDDRFSRIPVIVLTSDTEAEVDSLNSGANDFISKPYPMHEIILARVRRTIELSENRDLIRWTERDHLTGLLNREYFYRYAGQYDTFRENEPTDAVVVDISHFHMINERYGRVYADGVLRRVGEELRELLKVSGGIACRREADTFLVYRPHGEDYAAFIDRLAAAAGGETRGRIRLRAGVYPNVDRSLDMERRFDHAKMAADSIRGSFTTTVAMYDDALREKEVFAERLLDDFQDALDRKQFLVYFQPKYDIRPDVPVIYGAEALVRWSHPELGMISPGIFIPLFESNGLIRDLDNYVWRAAAEHLRDWKTRLGTSVPVSVNVSRVDMMDPELPDTLRSLVEENGLDCRDLHLEITESAYTEDAERIVAAVNGLREAGFLLEMDDFGSGYSSLNMITTLPIDLLKVDMMFIRHAFSEGGDTRILKVIVDIARSLSVPMVAEGVETEEQMLALRELGCDIVQGYYFSRPVPANEFEAFIRD